MEEGIASISESRSNSDSNFAIVHITRNYEESTFTIDKTYDELVTYYNIGVDIIGIAEDCIVCAFAYNDVENNFYTTYDNFFYNDATTMVNEHFNITISSTGIEAESYGSTITVVPD